jgi:hypothetical protein
MEKLISLLASLEALQTHISNSSGISSRSSSSNILPMLNLPEKTL